MLLSPLMLIICLLKQFVSLLGEQLPAGNSLPYRKEKGQLSSPFVNSHGLFKLLINPHWEDFLKHFQDSRVLFSFLKVLILFLCLLSKILSQLRQAEFPFWAYQYSSGLSTGEVSSSKSVR